MGDMNSDELTQRIDHELIGSWLRARSVARVLPAPIADHGGWRIDTAAPDERRRYVFARAEQGLRALADEIVEPQVFLKLCGSAAELRALLPARWELTEPRYVMTARTCPPGDFPLAAGYGLDLSRDGAVTNARILTDQGELAASGVAAESDGVFIYDRIATALAHRRRGLAAHLMRALCTQRRSQHSIQILVATEAGQAVYASLGWRIGAPYSTAHIPCAQGAPVASPSPTHATIVSA
jgi:GNAT superfamily N-acetyltransferase